MKKALLKRVLSSSSPVRSKILLAPVKEDETVRRLLALEDERTGGFVEPFPVIRLTKAYPNPHDSDTPRAKLLDTLRNAQVEHSLVTLFEELPIDAQLLLCNTTYKMSIEFAHETRSLTTLLNMARGLKLGHRRHDKSDSWHDRYKDLADSPYDESNKSMDGYEIGFLATIRDLNQGELQHFKSLSVESKKWVSEWLTHLPPEKHTNETALLLWNFAHLYFDTIHDSGDVGINDNDDTPQGKLLKTLRTQDVNPVLVAFFEKLPIDAQLLLYDATDYMEDLEEYGLTELLCIAREQVPGNRCEDRGQSWRDRYDELAKGNSTGSMDDYEIELKATIPDIDPTTLYEFNKLCTETKKWLLEWLIYLSSEHHTSDTVSRLVHFTELYFDIELNKNAHVVVREKTSSDDSASERRKSDVDTEMGDESQPLNSNKDTETD